MSCLYLLTAEDDLPLGALHQDERFARIGAAADPDFAVFRLSEDSQSGEALTFGAFENVVRIEAKALANNNRVELDDFRCQNPSSFACPICYNRSVKHFLAALLLLTAPAMADDIVGRADVVD